MTQGSVGLHSGVRPAGAYGSSHRDRGFALGSRASRVHRIEASPAPGIAPADLTRGQVGVLFVGIHGCPAWERAVAWLGRARRVSPDLHLLFVGPWRTGELGALFSGLQREAMPGEGRRTATSPHLKDQKRSDGPLEGEETWHRGKSLTSSWVGGCSQGRRFTLVCAAEPPWANVPRLPWGRSLCQRPPRARYRRAVATCRDRDLGATVGGRPVHRRRVA